MSVTGEAEPTLAVAGATGSSSSLTVCRISPPDWSASELRERREVEAVRLVVDVEKVDWKRASVEGTRSFVM